MLYRERGDMTILSVRHGCVSLILSAEGSSPQDVFSSRIARTTTGSALPLVSFWTKPISLFRTFLFPFLTAWTCREARKMQYSFKMRPHEKCMQTFFYRCPHLVGMRVYNLLADAVQLCGVTNQPQVLLLGDLQGRLARWPPHLLEHLKTGKSSAKLRSEEYKWALAGMCISQREITALCAADWPAWQRMRRCVLFPGAPAAQPGQRAKSDWKWIKR